MTVPRNATSVTSNALHEVLTESGLALPREFCPHLRLREDLGLDSLELAVLAVKIESETGIDVFADGNCETVGDIVDKLSKQ